MENGKPVVVVGATGYLGTEICRQLIARNQKVRGLVRSTSDPSKIKALQELGVETVKGDIKEPSSLKPVFQNAGAVISTASSTFSSNAGDSIATVDRQGQLNVVAEAAEAGVKRFVYVSFLESAEQFPLQDAKRAVEKKLMTSGMTYTILRPTFFMEIWISPHLGFDPTTKKATIYGHGVNEISFISIKDVAAFAVNALSNREAENAIIDLGGPEAISPLNVVRTFEEQEGYNYQLQYVPVEALKAQKEGSDNPLQESFAALMLTYAAGAAVPMKETAMLFGVIQTSLRDYSRHLLRATADTFMEA